MRISLNGSKTHRLLSLAELSRCLLCVTCPLRAFQARGGMFWLVQKRSFPLIDLSTQFAPDAEFLMIFLTTRACHFSVLCAPLLEESLEESSTMWLH